MALPVWRQVGRFSSCLYVAAKIVEPFGADEAFAEGVLHMVQELSMPTFQTLSEVRQSAKPVGVMSLRGDTRVLVMAHVSKENAAPPPPLRTIRCQLLCGHT